VFDVSVRVHIRPAKREDIAKLEWHGQFAHLRQIFRRSYQGHIEGHRYMLIADSHTYPIGRLFINKLGKNPRLADGNNRAYLYSFQVMEAFQGCGIGTQLIHQAEQYLHLQRFRMATIAVAKTNTHALRLYKRLGYNIFADDEGRWSYTDHRGILREVNEPGYLLEKRLMMR
jgi:ribosomal protein S18 acetylase RimI-like enzyme